MVQKNSRVARQENVDGLAKRDSGAASAGGVAAGGRPGEEGSSGLGDFAGVGGDEDADEVVPEGVYEFVVHFVHRDLRVDGGEPKSRGICAT